MSLILESNNTNYYTRNIRDIETIYCIKNNQIYINYIRIVNRFKNNDRSFGNIVTSIQFLEDLQIYAGRKPCVKPPACCRNNNILFNREESFNNVRELLNEVDFFFSISINNTVRGTFGPIDFIDSLLFNLSPDYRQEVHNLMNSIQNLADANNSSFIETLQRIMEELQNRVRDLEERNRNLNNEKEIYRNKFEYTNIVSRLKNEFINDNFEELHRRFDEQDNQHQKTN